LVLTASTCLHAAAVPGASRVGSNDCVRLGVPAGRFGGVPRRFTQIHSR
jgi:hypothetical protein